MRYPPEHKAEVRERIIEAAARAFRERGVDGVGIPKLMQAVGLTHGGFYAHFADRDELVAEAIHAAARGTSIGLLERSDLSFDEVLEQYLSPAHRKHPEAGCVLAALGGEAPRQSSTIRRAFGYVADGFLRRIDGRLHPRGKRDEPHDDAIVAAATMIGAMVLARMLDRDPLADRVLDVARKAVRAMARR
jgi:TetR/AcrR family transcriptional repressor of nem operon